MSLAMTRAEREEFLADTHVAAVSIAEDGRGPLTVPVWYRYEPGGELFFVTGGRSRKADLLRRTGRASVLVQSETVPYKYVSVEGPARFLDQIDHERDVRSVAVRYLGAELGEAYLVATADERAAAEEVLVALRPERWYAVDYGKMGL